MKMMRLFQLNPSTIMENMYGMTASQGGMMSTSMSNSSVWNQLLDNQKAFR